VDVTFPHNIVDGSKTYAFRGSVNYDEVAESSDTETASTAYSLWSSSLSYYEPVWKTNGQYWHAATEGFSIDKRLTSPIFNPVPGQDFVLSFDHRYSFEWERDGSEEIYYDGGFIEVSVNEGAWVDAASLPWGEGSTVTVEDLPVLDAATPYLGGRTAFAKLSAKYPAFEQVKINFGKVFANFKNVRVRFRMASDGAVGSYGWDIDNIKVEGVSNKAFSSRVAESFTGEGTAPACNVPPIAIPGEAIVVDEFTADEYGVLTPTVITLNGGGSVDPDGTGPLTYAWKQVHGPTVNLTGANTANPTFTANVRATTIFTFRLVVSDGVSSSLPKEVQVQVNNVNRLPTALARVLNNGPTTVDERSGTITLDGTGSKDPDGEALNYEWEQLDGPEVEMDDFTSAQPTFEIPEVTEDTDLVFALWVNDNKAWGEEPSIIVITVKNVDRGPTASAGENQRVAPGSTVTLTGEGIDEDGDDVTYAWTQTSGTPVTLTGADTATPTFTAPTVTGSVDLVFSLVVTAGGVSSEASTVTVTVARDNHKPTVNVAGAYTVHEGANVKLVATAVDEDGDELTYKWVQVAGQAITLSDTTSSELKFVAPDVDSESTLLFRVRVSDGIDTSDAVEVAVTVRNLPEQSCSAAGSGASGAVIPALMMLSLMLRRRRK